MKMAAFVVSNGLLTQVQNANRRRRRVTGFRCVASLSAKGVFADVGSGVISVSGADRIRFLHNMSTNNLAALKSGDVRLSTMTNSIGRAIELLAVLMDEESCILIVSKDKVEDIISTFDKYIFPRDKVAVEDETFKRSVIHLVEPNVASVPDLAAVLPEPGSLAKVKLAGCEVIVASGSGIYGLDSYTFLAHPDDAEALVKDLLPAVGNQVLDKDDWELQRILAGRPQAGSELTDKYNPLEAGLWKTVSFKKGCYIGQETIARLKTYDGVKKKLFGVDFSAPVEAGAAVLPKGGTENAGVVTSAGTTSDGRHIALAYIKSKFGGVGLEVEAGSAIGTVRDVPFATRDEDQCADAGLV